MPNNKIFYKYRSLKDFKFFMDIIVNNRLYAAKYNELNDIREGHYMQDGSLKKIIDRKSKKKCDQFLFLSSLKDVILSRL